MYEFRSPEGKRVRTKNLRRYCREHKLSYNCMKNLMYGIQDSHKGYTTVRSKKKKVRLQNIRSGEIVLVTGTLKSFAKERGLHPVVLSRLVTKKIAFYQDWCLEKTAKVLDKWTVI